MVNYVSAYFNEESFNEQEKPCLEDRFIHYLFEQLPERAWIYHYQEDQRHWVIFKSDVLEQILIPDISNADELAFFIHNLKDTQFNAYSICHHCGMRVFNYVGCTYRDVNNCVGRSFECCECQSLVNKDVFKLQDIQRRFGTGAAVYELVKTYLTPVHLTITADLSHEMPALERELLDELVKQNPTILDGERIHFHPSVLAHLDISCMSPLYKFKQTLLDTKFRAYPICKTCGQVLFGYPGVKDKHHSTYVHCFDCDTLTPNEQEMVQWVCQTTKLNGREAYEEAQKRIEARRSVKVLENWTPVEYFDDEGYYCNGFIIANSHQLEAGTTFDANELSLEYHVVDARSMAEAKYRLEKETDQIWIRWNGVEVEEDFVQPDESFVRPEDRSTNLDDGDDLPF